MGKLESELSVHDMVSIGGRQQTVLFPAEQEKLLESLMTQVAPPGGAQREARVICFSMICLAVGVASVLVMSVLVVVLMVLVVLFFFIFCYPLFF